MKQRRALIEFHHAAPKPACWLCIAVLGFEACLLPAVDASGALDAAVSVFGQDARERETAEIRQCRFAQSASAECVWDGGQQALSAQTVDSGGTASRPSEAGGAGSSGSGAAGESQSGVAADSGVAGDTCVSRCDGDCVVLASDSQHCGSCGNDCMGAACRDGSCVPVEVVAASVLAMTVDASNVYWTEWDKVLKAPLRGGEPTVLATDQLPGKLAVDSASLYWVNMDGIVKARLDGTQLTTLAAGWTAPAGIAADADYLYFSGAPAGDGTSLVRVSKHDGLVTKLASSDRGSLTVVAGEYVYFSSDTIVQRVPRGGGSVESVLAVPGKITDLAADNTYLCVAVSSGDDAHSGTVQRISLAGGTPVALAIGLTEPTQLEIDDHYVYWHDRSSLVRQAIDGSGLLQTLNSTYTRLVGLAFDASAIYFSTGGAVMKIPKPR